jgi:hypothetical protein
MIEKEYKYILRHDVDVESILKNNIVTDKYTVIDIFQGYLTKGNRIREYTYKVKNGLVLLTPEIQKVRTFKLPLKDPSECLEFEDPISDNDFELAYEMATDLITKTRYVIYDDGNMKWELDFFQHEDYTYLQMAECEVFNGYGRPTVLPKIVEDNLLYVVPDGDERFGNKHLSDVKQVKNLLKDLC